MIGSLSENVVLTIAIPSGIILGALGLWLTQVYRRRKK